MLLHLEQPYVAVLVCTGNTHEEPVVLGFPDQKGKKFSPADVETGLRAIAIKHGWFTDETGEPDSCPRCGVEIAKVALARAKEAFENPGMDAARLEELTLKIELLDAYLGKFDSDRKNDQPDLPFDGDGRIPDEDEDGAGPEDEQEEPEPEEAAVGAADGD